MLLYRLGTLKKHYLKPKKPKTKDIHKFGHSKTFVDQNKNNLQILCPPVFIVRDNCTVGYRDWL
jgi:hypothetical protein